MIELRGSKWCKDSQKMYIISDGTGFYKIGVSKDVTARIKNLQTANATKFKLVLTIESVGAANLEKFFHCFFNDKRVEGEWFKLTEEDLLKVGKVLPSYEKSNYFAEMLRCYVEESDKQKNELICELDNVVTLYDDLDSKLDNLIIEEMESKINTITREGAYDFILLHIKGLQKVAFSSVVYPDDVLFNIFSTVREKYLLSNAPQSISSVILKAEKIKG